jgi:hypothetical protein
VLLTHNPIPHLITLNARHLHRAFYCLNTILQLRSHISHARSCIPELNSCLQHGQEQITQLAKGMKELGKFQSDGEKDNVFVDELADDIDDCPDQSLKFGG